ncbi:MAG TPA: hypothetical protein VFY40_29030 [Blastocatellia bacterium]|nr:hypothetical protein [Blastocatellia bacterium]
MLSSRFVANHKRSGTVNESPFIHKKIFRGRRDYGIAFIERYGLGPKHFCAEQNHDE